jgi:hypothetical protein
MLAIEPFKIEIARSDIEDLRGRLRNARWPEKETVDDWSQGVPTKYHKDFCDYWANDYDWYARQARLNQLDQYQTLIDGLSIHFIHVRSSNRDAIAPNSWLARVSHRIL